MENLQPGLAHKKTVYYLASEGEMNSNSHPLPYSNNGKEHLQKIKTWTNCQSNFVANIYRKLWNLFNSFWFQTTELISQSLRPSQNPTKDPRGTPEHGTSIELCRRPWNVNPSSGVSEVMLHINPTCGVEAELGIQIPTETVLNGTYWKKELHNAPPYISESADITIARITIPVQSCSSFDWVGTHRPNAVKMRKAWA